MLNGLQSITHLLCPPKIEEPQPSEGYYRVTGRNLSPQHLRESVLPDATLLAVHTTFRTGNGNEYRTVFVPVHPLGPYVLLSEIGKSARYFTLVEHCVAHIINGKPTHDIISRPDDMCEVIRLSAVPTQHSIAEFVDSYAALFNDVSIPVAHYKNVSPWVVEHMPPVNGSLYEISKD